MTESSMTGRRRSQPVQHHPVLAVRPDERPPIVCPPWCVDTYEHHLAELGDWEGFVIHHSGGGEVFQTSETYPDGTLSDDPPQIYIDVRGDGVTVDHAERLARAILAAVEEVRA